MSLSQKVYQQGDRWIANVWDPTSAWHMTMNRPTWTENFPSEALANSAADEKMNELMEVN